MIKTIGSLLIVATLVGCSTLKTTKAVETETADTIETTQLKTEGAKITCESCSIQEQMALEAFQKRGITDKYALATLMGNVKHESQFKPDICEGGARVPYEHCHTGGFGLIQWTTVNRYNGLGNFCRNYDCNPSTTEGQLRYLFNEVQWQQVEPYFKTPGKSIDWYMKHAYTWLGWGIHGHRTAYAHQYLNILS